MGLHPGVGICSISKSETELVLSHLEEKGRIELDFSPVVLSDNSKRLRLKKVARLSKNVKNF
jgi:hypothetical protein